MKVQSTDKNTFRSRIIPPILQRDIIRLKTRMDADVIILQSQEKRQIVRIRCLDIDGKAKFKDGRFIARKDKHNNFIPYGENTALIEFGKVKFIANVNGNVVYHKKPFFISWSKIFQKAEQYVRTALDNYRDDKIVTKQVNKQEKLTSAGKNHLEQEFHKVMDAFNKLNPFKE